MRWAKVLGGFLLGWALMAPAAAGAVSLHHIYRAGDCDPATIETIDAPVGTISIHLHIRNWSAGAYAGIPYWIAFQRWEPEANGYTGWAPYLSHAAGSDFMHEVSSKRTPYEPTAGGELDYVEQDQVTKPFRFQVQLAGPTWHSGDGACHQGAMETWLTIDVAGGVSNGGANEPASAGSFTGQYASNWGAMMLDQSGSSLSGTFEHNNGRVAGRVEGSTATGYWMQDTSGQRCDTMRNGTYFWGRFRWTLAADGRGFEGLWGYCDGEPNSGWTATRTGGQAQTYQPSPPPPQPPSDHRYSDQNAGQPWSGSPPPPSDHQYSDRNTGQPWSESQAPPAERKLFDNWNTAACDVTDTAILDLDHPIRLSRVELWFNWREGETQVRYSVSSDGRDIGGGTLTRAECDPYQGAWCEAVDSPDADLAAGRYAFRTERDGVCQNGGSGGQGFIKAYGHETAGMRGPR